MTTEERLEKIQAHARAFEARARASGDLAHEIQLLLGRLVDLEALCEEYRQDRLARYQRSLTVSDADIDPWTGVVGFFKD